MNRREFFTKGLTNTFAKISREVIANFVSIKQVINHYTQPSDLSDFDIFFLGTFYPMMKQMPDEEVLEHAKKLGINPDNMSKMELIRKIFEFEQDNINKTKNYCQDGQ